MTDEEWAALKAEVARLEMEELNPGASMAQLVNDWARLSRHLPALLADLDALRAVLRAKSTMIAGLEAEVERLRDEIDEVGGVEPCLATHDGLCVDIGTDQECWTSCRAGTEQGIG